MNEMYVDIEKFTYNRDNVKEKFVLSEDVCEMLETYNNLLIKWQNSINLVSNNTIENAWHRHFADSMQISKFIPDNDRAKIYTDLGCGAGFPGLVVAIMRQDLNVHLVESDERKGQFMRTVIREVGIRNSNVHTSRIEDIIHEFTPDYISARALAPLHKLLDYCWSWVEVNPKIKFYLLKGKNAKNEIEYARNTYNFDVKLIQSITSIDAQVLVLEDIRKS